MQTVTESHLVRRVKFSGDTGADQTVHVFTREGTAGRHLTIQRKGTQLTVDDGRLDPETGDPIGIEPIVRYDLVVDADILSGELTLTKAAKS